MQIKWKKMNWPFLFGKLVWKKVKGAFLFSREDDKVMFKLALKSF